MIDIRQQVAQKLGLVSDDGERSTEGPKGVKSLGPRPVRYITSGQVRRAQERAERTKSRKINKAYRRRWMNNQLAIAALRGQLITIGQVPGASGEAANTDVGGHVARLLEERYGSVAEARATYFNILAEQARGAA